MLLATFDTSSAVSNTPDSKRRSPALAMCSGRPAVELSHEQIKPEVTEQFFGPKMESALQAERTTWEFFPGRLPGCFTTEIGGWLVSYSHCQPPDAGFSMDYFAQSEWGFRDKTFTYSSHACFWTAGGWRTRREPSTHRETCISVLAATNTEYLIRPINIAKVL